MEKVIVTFRIYLKDSILVQVVDLHKRELFKQYPFRKQRYFVIHILIGLSIFYLEPFVLPKTIIFLGVRSINLNENC